MQGVVVGHVSLEPQSPHFIKQPLKIFFWSKTVPVFLPSWKVEIPEIFIEVEDKEKVKEAREANHAEEQHEESVEQLDHLPVNALAPVRQQNI